MENRLIKGGLVLFLLGLLTGLAVPTLAAPRLGLSAHLEGVMNGIFLVLVGGVVWARLAIRETLKNAVAWSLLYGTFTNWFTVLLAAVWGAGSELMPLASGGATGTAIQEALVKFGLVSLSLAMIFAVAAMVWGLAGKGSRGQDLAALKG